MDRPAQAGDGGEFVQGQSVRSEGQVESHVGRIGDFAPDQTSLDELSALLDRPLAELVLAGLYPSAKGEKAWPPLALFKALLLATGS